MDQLGFGVPAMRRVSLDEGDRRCKWLINKALEPPSNDWESPCRTENSKLAAKCLNANAYVAARPAGNQEDTQGLS